MKRNYWMVLYDNAQYPFGVSAAIQKPLTKEYGRRLAGDGTLIMGDYGKDKEHREYRVTEKRMFIIRNEERGFETLFIIVNADRIK